MPDNPKAGTGRGAHLEEEEVEEEKGVLGGCKAGLKTGIWGEGRLSLRGGVSCKLQTRCRKGGCEGSVGVLTEGGIPVVPKP